MLCRRLACLIFTGLAVTAAPAASASDVTSYVPKNAYGFLVVHDMSMASAKVEKLLAKFDAPVPPLLTFFKEQTGLDKGINAQGDMLIALLPGKEPGGEPGPVLLLPVASYSALAGAVEADPSGEISAVTLRGEDLLLVKKGEYALLMDPEYRTEMESIVAADAAIPRSIAAFQAWMESNDAVAVILPNGAKFLVEMGKKELAEQREQMGEMFEDADMDEQLRSIQQTFTLYDQVLDLLGVEVNAVALGLSLDDAGNLRLGKRVDLKPAGNVAQLATVQIDSSNRLGGLPAGPFVVAGGGPWPQEWTDAIMKFSLDFMRTNPELLRQAYGVEELSDEDVTKLGAIARDSMASLQSMAFCYRPGADDDPMMDGFLAIMGVTDSQTFLNDYTKAVDAWMDVLGQKSKESKYKYELTEEEIAGQAGLKVTMDIGEMMEDESVLQIVEMMFGGGDVASYIGVVDKRRISMSYGKESVEGLITAMRQGGKELAADSTVAKTKALLPNNAPWVGYISPKGCVDFARRMLEIILGGFGGTPDIPEYPETPPIGFSMNLTEHGAESDMVVPVEAIDGLSEYIREASE